VVTLWQLVPPAFVVGLAGTLVAGLVVPWMPISFLAILLSYLAVVLACAVRAAPSAGVRVAACLVAAFPAVHLSYGVGFLRGMLDFLALRQRRVQKAGALPVSR
jgi:hypothetical protein